MTVHYRDERKPRSEWDREARAATSSRATTVGLWLIFFALIFLQRLGVGGVPMAFAVGYLVILALILLRAIVLDKLFVIFFMIATSLATMSVFLSWRTESSYESYLYLLSILVIYTLRFRDRATSFETARRIFLRFMLIAAICGIVQFGLQFVIGRESVFPLETLPEDILLKGYNVIIPLTYGADIIKSNGVFFLEPSFFSQFLAMAIILELLGRQRASRCAIYAIALITSYSGTGIMTLALFLPFVLARRANMALLLAAVALIIVVSLTASVLELDTFFNRAGEFSSPESSGFARFISPFLLVRDFLIPSPVHFLFGMGPGTIDVAVANAIFKGYLAHDPTWIKLIFEYGLVGGISLMAYVITAMYAGSRDKLVSLALIFNWLFLGGYLLSGMMNIFLISLGALHSKVTMQGAPVMSRPVRRRRLTQW